MKKNMGNIDRLIRTLLAILVGILYYTGYITGTTAVVLGVIAVIFLLTSLISICPIYMPFGLSTKKE